MDFYFEPLPVERIDYRELRKDLCALIVETPYGVFGFELPPAKAEKLATKLKARG